jgi:hypothetical protein
MLNCIVRDVLGMDEFDACSLSFVLDASGFGAILEGIQSLLVKFDLRRDAGYHDCFGIASQGVLEDAGEFGIAEGDEGRLFLISQDVDALAESE